MEKARLLQSPDALPPQDARLLSPGERIETPVDDRGLVIISQLIKDIKATVDPSFQWLSEPDVHHFYWPKVYYPHNYSHDEVSYSKFKNLPVHKGKIPRGFHDYLHQVTEPPKIPAEDVMEYRIEAWEVASSLFRIVRRSVQWERTARRFSELKIAIPPRQLIYKFSNPQDIDEEIIQETMNKHFGGLFEEHINRLDRIPPEFRIIEPVDSPTKLASSLGRFAVHGSHNLVQAVAA